MKDINLIFEKSNQSLSGFHFNRKLNKETIKKIIPEGLQRKKPMHLPTISENEIIRHYIRLSNRNFGVDSGFYPLGSCTMKYNPKICEKIARISAFTNAHPYSDQERVQGHLQVMYECKNALIEITGMDDLTLSPCAGAHGELTGLFIIRAYFKHKKEKRTTVLIPDSAHGTNPASSTMAGFNPVTVKSLPDGFINIKDLQEKAGQHVAALMLTNPNTVGLFEKDIEKIIEICKQYDIQLYYDGANLNALLGIARPGDFGFDVVHINLHKTFATPHGGGGPGAGAVGVKKHLSDFLPGEDIAYVNHKYVMTKRGKTSFGKVRAFYANFMIVLRAYIYIDQLGKEGLDQSGLIALLNANYLGKLLAPYVDLATKDHIMHEFVISLTALCQKHHLTIIDFAKRILDYGYHAPTVSFPLIIHDCLMIEPTETESKKTLDDFAAVLIKIFQEAEQNPELLKKAPTTTCIRRPDEVKAAREPYLKYEM